MGVFAAVSTKETERSQEPITSRALPAVNACELSLVPELENAIDTLWLGLRQAGGGVAGEAGHRAVVTAHWEPGDGATTVATALALRAAQLEPATTICIADFDLLNPGLSSLTGLEVQPGLADVLCAEAPLDRVIARSPLPNLFVLPAGNPDGNRRLAQTSLRCRELCRQLIAEFDYVLFDVPVLREQSSFARWPSGLAQSILVIRAGSARRQAVAKAARTLELLRLPLAAVVLNRREYYLPQWLYVRT